MRKAILLRTESFLWVGHSCGFATAHVSLSVCVSECVFMSRTTAYPHLTHIINVTENHQRATAVHAKPHSHTHLSCENPFICVIIHLPCPPPPTAPSCDCWLLVTASRTAQINDEKGQLRGKRN